MRLPGKMNGQIYFSYKRGSAGNRYGECSPIPEPDTDRPDVGREFCPMKLLGGLNLAPSPSLPCGKLSIGPIDISAA
jgi:hypothetical protein